MYIQFKTLYVRTFRLFISRKLRYRNCERNEAGASAVGAEVSRLHRGFELPLETPLWTLDSPHFDAQFLKGSASLALVTDSCW